MHEKWNKINVEKKFYSSSSQSIPENGIDMGSEPIYRSKLLKKSPSLRALQNYNNLSIGDDNTDSLTFIPETQNYNDYTTQYQIQNGEDGQQKRNNVESTTGLDGCESGYSTVCASSVPPSYYGSEIGSEKNEMGSTTKLVTSKMGMSCKRWFTHIEAVLCTISLAAGFGNLYRLPQTTLIRGGLPFLIVYIILVVLIGLPLLFLELGIGQLAQEGLIKSWRAVPFFKGLGYIKLIAGCLLSIYYPLYMGLSVYYVIWTSAKSIPFPECASVKMTDSGYSPNGIDGQQCLKKTFLESPFKDPYWFGIFGAILFIIWLIIIFSSITKRKSFLISLFVLIFPVVGGLISLTVKSVLIENKTQTLHNITTNIDWTILENADVWYYATVQVFFSTTVGFGSFVTNAGVIYNKVNPLWTALGYITVNLVFGVGTVLIFYILFGQTAKLHNPGDMPEVHLASVIYTVLINSKPEDDLKYWAIIVYLTILLSGFISMATIVYTLLKAITVQMGRRFKWWQTSIVLGFIGFMLGCCVLFQADFQIVRLLDHYIVGNLILVSVIIEVFALIGFYGTDRIKSDFEFMLGHILSNIWLILWWFLPLLLTAIFAWSLITLPSQDQFIDDPIWLTATGWSIVLTSIVFIIIIGFYTVTKQEAYSFLEKFKQSLKPSNNWGPKDPMRRHNWVQWNTKTQHGERDFTLKRKGTRDYTRTIKKQSKKAAINEMSADRNNYDHVQQMQEGGTSTRKFDSLTSNPLKVTSLIDSLDSNSATYPNLHLNGNEEFKTHVNPLSRTPKEISESSLNIENSTSRKGPYIISKKPNINHVCHRRFSEIENA